MAIDSVSLSANTRAALNGAEGNAAVTALKIAVESERAIASVIEQVVESAPVPAPAGQGRNVDKLA
jgi:hypothetical protein